MLKFFTPVALLVVAACTLNKTGMDNSKVADAPVSSASAQVSVDCSEAYGEPASCNKIACSEKYLTFIVTWEGDFSSYVREKSTNDKTVERPLDMSGWDLQKALNLPAKSVYSRK